MLLFCLYSNYCILNFDYFYFPAMSDFQYLPISASSSEADDTKCVLEEIIPSGVDSLETLMYVDSWFI